MRTLGGMVMDARLEQPKNALEPILMTLGGMAIEARFEQPEYL